jgi:hypothetical protein
MTTRDRLTVAAAIAVALATSALRPLTRTSLAAARLGAIVAVSGAAALARLAAAPRGRCSPSSPCSRLLAYTVALTFAGSTRAYGCCRDRRHRHLAGAHVRAGLAEVAVLAPLPLPESPTRRTIVQCLFLRARVVRVRVRAWVAAFANSPCV